MADTTQDHLAGADAKAGVAFTRGPWQRSGVRTRLGPEDCLRVGPDGCAIAFIPIGKSPAEHAGAMADARLIAVAPEMLQKLRDIVALADRNVSHNPDGTPNRTAEAKALYESTIELISRATGVSQ